MIPMTDYTMVRFTDDFDQRFKGVDLEDYGPFECFDTVRLPEPNADLLVDIGVARRLNA